MSEPTATNPQTGETLVFRGGAWVSPSAPPAPRGPVYGPAVTPKAPPAPNLPTGYRIGPDGTAERIPGLPPDKNASDGVGAAMTNNKRIEMQDELNVLDQFEMDLKNLEGQYNKSFKNQGVFGTIREIVPEALNTTNQDYNETARRLLPLVAKALGFTAKQMDTPAELKRLEAYVPSNTDGDATAERKLKVLRAMLARQRANRQKQLGAKPANQGSAPKRLRYNPATGELE